MSPEALTPVVWTAGTRPMFQIESHSAAPRYFFTYSIKTLSPRERNAKSRVRDRHLDQEVQRLCARLGEEGWTPGALIRHLDTLVHAQYSKAAVLNLFLVEVQDEQRKARFWFHGSYEVFLWHPEHRTMSLPISHLPSLGLLSESLNAASRQPGYAIDLSVSTLLVVWMLDQDYLYGKGMGDVMKELWDHLLEGRSIEEFQGSVLGRKPFSESLPLYLVDLTRPAPPL